MGIIRVRIICLADENYLYNHNYVPDEGVSIGTQLRAIADTYYQTYGRKNGWTVTVAHLPDGVPAEVAA